MDKRDQHSEGFLVPSAYLQPILTVCRGYHLDFAKLLASEHISTRALAGEIETVDYESYVNLLNRGSNWSKNLAFGHEVAKHYELQTTAELTYLIAKQEYLAQIYPALSYIVEAQSRGVYHELEVKGSMAYHCVDYEKPASLNCDQSAQLLITFYHLTFKRLLGSAWKPTSVSLEGNRHIDIRTLEQFFGCKVIVEQPCNFIEFPAALLYQRFESTLPESKEVTMETSKILKNFDDLEGLVSKYIEFGLESGSFAKEDIAKQLCVHPRVLQNRLSEKGLKFRDLLNYVRKKRAEFLLRHTQKSILAISHLLGYQDSRTFIRAFKTWFGATPDAWRGEVLATS
ncbi:AraC family transcriptional regulator [Vibrio sp. ER1A]|uniref:AraC family transcriptional regulator n=1 Tax=Vibrio sp. ER1A TaxID=1517681 RepID=UPI0004DCBAA0|nr:AraC family transcriptional regulator [Vibrio sp. ER1A]KFA99399.1 hypothetical protein HW45_03835 [Vibrio sp. ER1A]